MRHRLAWFFGALLVAGAAYSVTSGLVWSTYFHPDEILIARWLNETNRIGYIAERAYPSGWFELNRIRFWLDKNIPKWVNSWNRHHIQNGRVAAVLADSYDFRDLPEIPRKKEYDFQDGRDFNAWLYVLTVLFLYAACLEAGLHPVAAFVSGLFFLASAEPLEFAHYCETDAGLLVSMAFFAWLAARALRRRSLGWALLASAAAGFAVSCEFTLAPLLLWCFLWPFVVPGRSGGSAARRISKTTLLPVVSLLLALGGYLLGTPAFRADPQWYMDMLGTASQSTYREIAMNLGGNYTWRGATVLRWASLGRHLGDLGILPLLWEVFAWGFWFLPRFRRQLAGIPGCCLFTSLSGYACVRLSGGRNCCRCPFCFRWGRRCRCNGGCRGRLPVPRRGG